jgi:choline kinase
VPRIFFDVAYLYYLTQFRPVQRVLQRRGIEFHSVVYERARQPTAVVRAAIARLGLSCSWVGSQEEALEIYRRERPDWVVFGHGFAPLRELPPGTRSAQLHHGIGMKADVYDADLCDMDVRFTEGPHYTRILRERFPRANLVEVGYVKVDPLFWPPSERPALDLPAVGLDPARPTLMYAPTSLPSSFGAVPDRWPEHFGAFNLIVKAHQFSYFNPRYRSHRRKMARWARYPNVHVVSPEDFDPNPYFVVSDLLISDASSVLFEFAAMDRPVVWCDFYKLPLSYRGPFRWRLERRLDHAIDQYRDICAHAGSYAELAPVVAAELARPGRHSSVRREITAQLVGPTDGASGERVADYLLSESGPKRDRLVPARERRVATAVILAAGMGTRLQQRHRMAPKGFLDVGGGPIIEESIGKLLRSGIRRIVIVTGHCCEHYEELARRRAGVIELVHNPRYAESSTMYSLACARDRVAADFLLLESDLIYERRALATLLEHPSPDAVLLSGFTQAGDEVFVETRAGMLVNMSKDRSQLGSEVRGELVGISKISSALYERMLAIADEAFTRDLRFTYEMDCLVAAAASRPIPCPLLEDLVWGEIDFEQHLERAFRIHPLLVEEGSADSIAPGASQGRIQPVAPGRDV